MRDDGTTIGIITGMAFERAVLMRWRGALGARMPMVTCAGADAGRAAEQAETLAGQGAAGLVSFGIAGGLDPSLTAGTLMLPREIRSQDGDTFACDIAWCDALQAVLAPHVTAHSGAIAGTADAIVDAAAKRSLRQRLSVSAVDMESAAVAGVAMRHALPFIAIRAIADTADQALPAAALAATREDGSVSVARALAACLRRPADIPALMRLGRHTGLAKRTLARVAHAGLPLFAFP